MNQNQNQIRICRNCSSLIFRAETYDAHVATCRGHPFLGPMGDRYLDPYTNPASRQSSASKSKSAKEQKVTVAEADSTVSDK